MKIRPLLAMMLCLGGCQWVRVADYKVCDATVECGRPDDADASVVWDAGVPGDGGSEEAGCVPEALPDLVDQAGLDTNCDGIDGVKERQLYVASDTGDDLTAEPGNPQKPFKTLKAALAWVGNTDAGLYDAVLVKQGTYAEPAVEWVVDVDIWGGRSGAQSWPRVGLSDLVGSRVGLVVRGIRGRALRSFQVHALPGGPSEASIAVVVEGGSPLFLGDELFAGPGGAGAEGTTFGFPDAGPGLPGTDGVTGLTTINPGAPGVCGADGYGGGGAGVNTVNDGNGQPGLGPDGGRGGGRLSCFGPQYQEASAGAPGPDGMSGADGADALGFGGLGQDLKWWGADGTAGQPGTVGGPGNGGGGGGSGPGQPSSGGSGGSGGCPGGGGLGGGAGGPSVGLLVLGGRPVLGEGTLVFPASGGGGGRGADGPGFPGGAGGSRGPSLVGCGGQMNQMGAAGGNGGRGGDGGRGGGGAGGHSFSVLCQLDAGVELDGGTLLAGVAGPGGAGVDAGRPGEVFLTWGCSP